MKTLSSPHILPYKILVGFSLYRWCFASSSTTIPLLQTQLLMENLKRNKGGRKKLLGKQNKNGDAFRDVLQGKLAASG